MIVLVRVRYHPLSQQHSAQCHRIFFKLLSRSRHPDMWARQKEKELCEKIATVLSVMKKKKNNLFYLSQVAHQASAYPGFCRMKQVAPSIEPVGKRETP